MDLKKIRDLYGEAQAARTEANALLAKGDLTNEEAEKVDRLLDTVEAKVAEAKRMERAMGLGAGLDTVLPSLDVQSKDAPLEIEYMGHKYNAEEWEKIRKSAPFPAYIRVKGDEQSEAYAKAVSRYIRTKSNGELTQAEVRALSVGDAQAGGVYVQDVFVNRTIVKSREVSAMRRLATVLPPVPSGSVIYPTEDDVFTDADWTVELGTGQEEAGRPFGEIRLTPYPFAKRIKVSNTLLRVPTFDAEAWLQDRMGYKFGVTEEEAFLNGNGAGRPLGLLADPNLPVYTTPVANTVTGDDLINWVYRLPAAYAEGASILCNRALIRKVRLLKDGGGNYLWQPGLQIGSPNRILDYPYENSDRFDDGLDGNDAWENGAIVAVIGDFRYYWIVDALQMSIQRLVELYAETNQTGYIGRKETGGRIVLHEAFLGLQVL